MFVDLQLVFTCAEGVVRNYSHRAKGSSFTLFSREDVIAKKLGLFGGVGGGF